MKEMPFISDQVRQECRSVRIDLYILPFLFDREGIWERPEALEVARRREPRAEGVGVLPRDAGERREVWERKAVADRRPDLAQAERVLNCTRATRAIRGVAVVVARRHVRRGLDGPDGPGYGALPRLALERGRAVVGRFAAGRCRRESLGVHCGVRAKNGVNSQRVGFQPRRRRRLTFCWCFLHLLRARRRSTAEADPHSDQAHTQANNLELSGVVLGWTPRTRHNIASPCSHNERCGTTRRQPLQTNRRQALRDKKCSPPAPSAASGPQGRFPRRRRRRRARRRRARRSRRRRATSARAGPPPRRRARAGATR